MAMRMSQIIQSQIPDVGESVRHACCVSQKSGASAIEMRVLRHATAITSLFGRDVETRAELQVNAQATLARFMRSC